MLEARLGSGGFGTVWRARNAAGTPGALKLIDAPPGDELRALEGVVHPSVPALLDAGSVPSPYLVMELARGRPLSRIIQQAAAPEPAACRVLVALADALAAVHAAGIHHGDLKPANIVVGRIRRGEIKLVDFGMVGHSGGSVAYVAPERLEGAPPSGPSDVYALGLCAWEMLHGSLPGAEEGLAGVLRSRRAPAPQPTAASPWLARLLQQMLEPDPSRRPTASAVVDTLAAHAFPPRPVDPQALRRRAKVATVPMPEVDGPIDRWVREGGHLRVAGASGTGRTQHADRALIELRAVGRLYARLAPGAGLWGPVEQVLSAASVSTTPTSLPDHPDQETRAILAAEAFSLRASGAIWVVCDDADRLGAPARSFLNALVTHQGCHVLETRLSAPDVLADVSLGPLAPDQVAEMVAQVLGGPPPLKLLEVLDAVASGNPQGIEDAIAAAAAGGALLRRNGRWMVDDAGLIALHHAGELADVGLAALRPAGVDPRVAGLLALTGGPMSIGDLARLTRQPEAELRDEVDLLLESGLLRCVGSGYAPSSSRALAALVGRQDTAPLHQALAVRQIEAGARAPDELARLARHLAAAGDAQLAETHGVAALQAACVLDPLSAAPSARALAALAPTPALTAACVGALRGAGDLDGALDLASRWLSRPHAERGGLPVRVAQIQALIERDVAAPEVDAAIHSARAICGIGEDFALDATVAGVWMLRKDYSAAEQSARAVVGCAAPSEPAQLEAWLRAQGALAQALHGQNRLDEGLALLEGLDPRLGEGTQARARLSGTQGLLLWHAGRMREAAAALGRSGDPRAGLGIRDRARTLNNAAAAWFQCGDRARAVSCWEEALLLFERLEDPLEQVRVQTNLCVGYSRLGRWQRSEQAGRWATEQAEVLGAMEYAAMAAGNLGDAAAFQGQADDAERWYARTEDIALRAGLDSEHIELARRRLELKLLGSRAASPVAAAEAAVRQARAAGARIEGARLGALVGLCLARVGRDEDSRAALAAAEEELRSLGAAGDLTAVRVWAAQAALERGEMAQASELLDRVSPWIAEVGDLPLRDRVDALRGELATSWARQAPAQASNTDDALLDLAISIAREQDPAALLQRVCEVALQAASGQRAFIIEQASGLRVRATARAPGAAAGEPSMSVVHRVVDGRCEVIVADVFEREDLRAAHSVMALSLRSAMAVPLLHGDELLGVLYVDSQHTTETELARRARGLRALASFASVAIDNARRMARAEERAARGREVAHDFRSPVAGVLATLDLLEEDEALSPVAKEAVDTVRRLSRRAYGLAEGFLREDRVRADRIDVAQLVHAERANLLPSATRAGVRLSAEICDGCVVQGDATDLARLVANLVGNALKYTPAGGEVTLSVVGDGDDVVLSVADTGPGLPAELIPHIFDAGAQATNARPGFGIGLAVVARVTREMGGTATAANQPSGGAIFSIRLPVA